LDRKDLAIGVLSTTGVVLLVGVLLVQNRPPAALAGGMTTTGGGYVVTVGEAAAYTEELVYILDTASERMLAYRFDPFRREIRVVQGIDLAQVREAAMLRAQQTSSTPNTP